MRTEGKGEVGGRQERKEVEGINGRKKYGREKQLEKDKKKGRKNKEKGER